MAEYIKREAAQCRHRQQTRSGSSSNMQKDITNVIREGKNRDWRMQ